MGHFTGSVFIPFTNQFVDRVNDYHGVTFASTTFDYLWHEFIHISGVASQVPKVESGQLGWPIVVTCETFRIGQMEQPFLQERLCEFEVHVENSSFLDLPAPPRETLRHTYGKVQKRERLTGFAASSEHCERSLVNHSFDQLGRNFQPLFQECVGRYDF